MKYVLFPYNPTSIVGILFLEALTVLLIIGFGYFVIKYLKQNWFEKKISFSQILVYCGLAIILTYISLYIVSLNVYAEIDLYENGGLGIENLEKITYLDASINGLGSLLMFGLLALMIIRLKASKLDFTISFTLFFKY